jgi:hypothetical protein
MKSYMDSSPKLGKKALKIFGSEERGTLHSKALSL